MVASILGFLIHKKYTLTLLWDENFFSLIWSNGVSKNLSFHTDFKNVNMTFVKSAPKKSFAKKNDFSISRIVFWLKHFLGALFTQVICTFLKSVQKDGFFMPHSTYSKKKMFHLFRDNELFWELKKGRNRSKFRKTVIYKQILEFHCPSEVLCHTSNLWNFVKITGPYWTYISTIVPFRIYEGWNRDPGLDYR